jgi:peptide/nickel transport system ATP-binding protein
MPSLLSASHVSMIFGGGGRLGQRQAKVALRDVSLEIDDSAASITAIVGESGSGKTTLTRLLLGLAAPTSGRVSWRGRELSSLRGSSYLAYRREVQAVFQDPFAVYNPFYRVDRALQLPLCRFGLVHGRDEARAKMEDALAAVGLRPQETLGRYPHQLSGGQRQRVMIARALLLQPSVIVADEPASMVDASLRATILDTLYRLKTERNISRVYVTHDLTTAYQIADQVLVMHAGEVVERGEVEAVIGHPQHSYTQSLIAAIPSIDPDVNWGLEDDTAGDIAWLS